MVINIKESDSPTGSIKTWLHDGYDINFFRWGSDDTLLSSLKIRAANIDERVLDLGSTRIGAALRHHMKLGCMSASIMIATAGGKDIAFCVQRQLKVPMKDGRIERVVFNAVRETDPDYQKHGIATAFLTDGREQFPLARYYTGRTQDEIVIASLEKSELFGDIYPIDKLFKDGSDPQQVLWYATFRSIWAEDAPIDIRTGLAKEVYSQGGLGGYVLDLTHPRIARIHQRFEELGLIKEHGDAISYVAECKQAPLSS